MPITHKFVSSKADPSDSSLIGATKWNDIHALTLARRTVSGNGSLLTTDEVVFLNGAGTFTLLDATTVDGQVFMIKRKDAGTSPAKVVTSNGQLIDGLYQEIDLTNQNQYVRLLADAPNARWEIIGTN